MVREEFVLPASATHVLRHTHHRAQSKWRFWAFTCFLLLAGLLVAYPAFASVGALPARLNDQAAIFSSEEVDELFATLEQHENATGQLFAVLTVPEAPTNIVKYAQNVFAEWGLHEREAALILIVPQQQRIHIHVGPRLQAKLPAHKAEAIGTGVIAPWFDAKRYFIGVNAGLDRMIKLGKGEDVVLLPETPVVKADASNVPLLELMLVLVALFGLLAHWTLGARRRLPEYTLGSMPSGPSLVGGVAAGTGGYQGRW